MQISEECTFGKLKPEQEECLGNILNGGDCYVIGLLPGTNDFILQTSEIMPFQTLSIKQHEVRVWYYQAT